MAHPFGDLLRQYRARNGGLSQTRLAELAGYDQAVLVRMSQGKKDLTGPSGRERVVRLIAVLHDEGALTTQGEANALLKAAGMPPLFEGQPAELALIKVLRDVDASVSAAQPASTSATPIATTPARSVTNLPAQLTTFIGREKEMAEVKALLATTRLLTLTGSGGAGKTRLAIKVGASFVGAGLAPALGGRPQGAERAPTPWPDGVWLVEFAALNEDRMVADSVAAALGLQAMSRTSRQVLTAHLSDQQTLLILDNCEHLLQGCSELAVALLQACPQLSLLVTSREPLNVPGEVTWRVPSLESQEAMRLFEERARAAKPDFVLTPANTPFVTQICQRLDDMPLALELAAARLRTFSVEQIASRLDDAFRLLTGGSRTALPRQQTLRATIEWSYNLLPEEERVVLAELSVFAGGWTLEAAEAIHGEHALELLDNLVNKSLVVAEEKPSGMRYHLLETIRQYAASRLASADEGVHGQVRQRHLEYFANLEQTGRSHEVGGPIQEPWLGILVAEIDNIREALSWAAQRGDWRTGTPLIERLVFIWNEPGCATEISRWIDMLVLSNPEATDASRVKGLLMAGFLQVQRGNIDGCVDWYRRASVLAHRIDDTNSILEADNRLGFASPDDAEAGAILERVIEYAKQAGRLDIALDAMETVGQRMAGQRNYDQAMAELEKCLAFGREIQIDECMDGVHWRMGQVYLGMADYARARAALDEYVARCRESEGIRTEPLVDLGTVGIYTGDYAPAREALHNCFREMLPRDNLERLAQGIVLAAGLAHSLGKLDQAARLLGAAAAIRRDHHTHGPYEHELFAEYDRRLPAVRAAMDPMAFERSWAEGQKLTLKEAIAEAQAV